MSVLFPVCGARVWARFIGAATLRDGVAWGERQPSWLRWIASAIRLMRFRRASQAAPDGRQLSDRPRELGLVHLVAALASGERAVHEPDPVEDAEVLGHRLSGHRQLVAQGGGRAAAFVQQQVEHPAAGRVPDRRPEVVVDRGGHDADPSRSAYAVSRGRKWSQPATCSLVLLLEHRRFPAELPETGLLETQQRAVPRREQVEGDEQRVVRGGHLVLLVHPAEREPPRRVGLDDRDRLDLRTFRPYERDRAAGAGDRVEVRLLRPPLAQVLGPADDLVDHLGRRLDVDLPLDGADLHAPLPCFPLTQPLVA